MKQLDGETSGPRGLKDIIGQLEHYKTLSVLFEIESGNVSGSLA